MQFLASIKTTLIAALVAWIVGYGVGYYTKGQFVKANQLDAVVEQRSEDSRTVKGMLNDEHDLQAKIGTSRSINTTIRKEIKKHETTILPSHADKDKGSVNCDSAVLGVDAVRLLNAARADSLDDPAAGSDGESAESSRADSR